MDIHKAFELRRSYRALEPFTLDKETLLELGKAAQLAPSCFNNQPWRFVFIEGSDTLKKIQPAISKSNSWVYEASLIIAVITENKLDCQLKDGREYSQFDTGIACGFIMLKATELGLVAHPIAGYNQNLAKEILQIPQEMDLINLIVVGKHAENYKDLLPEEKISVEENRPERKKLSEFIFLNQYGNPIPSIS